MSSGPENRFIQSVHSYLPPKEEFHREKMNNPYSSGTADCWYSGKRDLWVEYKFIEVPKRGDTMIEVLKLLSPLQDHWLRGRRNEGREVWVIVGCKAGGVIWAYGGWHIPMAAVTFRELILPKPDVARAILDWCQCTSKNSS